MKAIQLNRLLILLFLFCLHTSACSDIEKNDESDYQKLIVGTWFEYKQEGYEGNKLFEVFEVEKDDVYYEAVLVFAKDGCVYYPHVAISHYKITGNTLECGSNSGTILKLNKNEMAIKRLYEPYWYACSANDADKNKTMISYYTRIDDWYAK